MLGSAMLEEATELIGLQVYTPNGIFLGNVNNLVIDLENKKVDGLFINETNPLLVEDSKAVNVPYRWIQSVGDVVILKYFPKRVTARKPAAAAKSAAPAQEE
jgi:sporulation protein YlmC with PRC-barrel domain